MASSDNTQKPNAEPKVRVVDRRWWAQQQSAEETAPADEGVRKPTYVEDLERQVADQSAQLQIYLTEHRRLLDEFEQAKVRIRRDVAREVERGKRTVLVQMLEVVDNLDRAIAAARQSAGGGAAEGLLRGVELVREQCLSALGSFGVARLDAVGRPFDASRHEAVTTTPVASAEQDGVIVAEVRSGYSVGDELLRPASVVVGQYQHS